MNRYDKRLSTPDDILGYLLAQKETAPSGKIIAIIGNSNTFKRFLAIGSSFCAAKKGYHTLFLTFDRLSSNLLQQMQCPALINKENGLPCVETAPNNRKEGQIQYKDLSASCSSNCSYDNCLLKSCKKCYDFLHAFNINMGCISSDELLYYLEEQLEIYFDEKGSRIKRIIFDDLQKVDFCFPLLRDNGLFFAALKSFCQKRGIDLIVLCDKKAELVNELISLSENVIYVNRENNPHEVSILIEKLAGNIRPSQIFKIKTKNIYTLFSCDFSDCSISESEQLEIEEIGTMINYWND